MEIGLTIYILISPVVAAVVLFIVWRAAYREFREVKGDKGDQIV